MSLNTQLLTLIFSYIFGFFFSLFLNINHKIIYNSKIIIKLLGTLLVVFSSVLVYFIILLKINNAILHPYELIMITLGFYTENIIKKQIKNCK